LIKLLNGCASALIRSAQPAEERIIGDIGGDPEAEVFPDAHP